VEYKNTVHISQEKHYFSATEPSRQCYIRFEVYTGVTMKNAVFWDIKTKFLPHKKYYVSGRCEVFTAVPMKNAAFWEHSSYRKQSSGMLSRMALVRTDVLEELSASIIRVTRVGKLGTLAVTSNRRMLRRNTISYKCHMA
jgi:hypothetical protein